MRAVPRLRAECGLRRALIKCVAEALITRAFTAMATGRIIATTKHDNLASIAVMLGLKTNIDIYRLPHPGSQIVGTLRASER
jgi:hypothetical protein